MTNPDQYIGTGPYRLVEWQRDAAMRFERFDDYQSACRGRPKGYGGTKYAYADAIEFIPVPDEAARVAGLQAGDYHLGARHRQRPVRRCSRISRASSPRS